MLVESDAPHQWLGGLSPRAMFDVLLARHGESSTTAARWLDGAPTLATVELRARIEVGLGTEGLPVVGLLEVFEDTVFDLIWPAQDNPYDVLCPAR